ncbi:hypothetical protein ACNTMW_03635 [Planosporangium sp. 12N6]|uniref:hypothetical protein n=1 Tax=Planosporangium spinosum TaxID=3402278 RepID=UPI003CE927EC
MVRGRFDFSHTALDNLELFGVTPREVLEALGAASRLVQHIDDDMLRVVAPTSLGRLLEVVLTERGDDEWVVFLAREAGGRAKQAFDDWAGGPR